MPILLKCPKGHSRKLGDEYAGTTAACQECGHVWKIPARKDALHNSMFASKSEPPPAVKCAWCYFPDIDPTRADACPLCAVPYSKKPTVFAPPGPPTAEDVTTARVAVEGEYRTLFVLAAIFCACPALGMVEKSPPGALVVAALAAGLFVAGLSGIAPLSSVSSRADAERKKRHQQDIDLWNHLSPLQHYHVADGKYQDALRDLERSPTSAPLRIKALDLGRAAAEKGRAAHDGFPSVTMYDEAKIANDIAARTGGAVSLK